MPVLETRDPIVSVDPTRDLLSQIADKWSILALIVLSTNDFQFNVLKREVSGITQKLT